MTGWDYIKIPGYETAAPTGNVVDPGIFEIFQGCCGGGTATAGTDTPISADASVAEALWEAQSAIIEEESAYLADLNAIFKAKSQGIPRQQNILSSLLSEVAEFAAGKLAYLLTLAKTGNPIIAEIAAFAVEVAVEKALEGLRLALDKGQALCTAIQAENAALLELESSAANYALRRDALAVHTEQIQNILLHISALEQQIVDGLGSGEAATDEDWSSWISAINSSTEGIETRGTAKTTKNFCWPSKICATTMK